MRSWYQTHRSLISLSKVRKELSDFHEILYIDAMEVDKNLATEEFCKRENVIGIKYNPLFSRNFLGLKRVSCWFFKYASGDA